MSEPFIAEIKIIAFSYAPRYWAMCDGQLLDIRQNQTLFALINTYYGGDGTTNMAVPDLRGRMAIHAGQGPGLSNYRPGQYGGMEQIQLKESQMPAHNHPATPSLTSTTPAILTAGDRNTPEADNTSVLAGEVTVPGSKGSRDPVNLYSTGTDTDNSLKPTPVEGNVAIGNTGGSQPHYNMPPFLTLNFIIALDGLFPPRN